MRPYLLKGHERPLTFIKYNKEGDLLFTCAKDSLVTLWFADNGQRVGTYQGHNGAVWQCDVSADSSRLLTSSADSTIRMWDVQSGKMTYEWKYREPCRAVSFGVGEEMAVTTADPFMGQTSTIHVIKVAKDLADQTSDDLRTISVDSERITRAFFYDLNKQIITAHENGTVRRWDVETGKCTQTERLHEKIINDLKFSSDGTHFVTASTDKNSHLVDAETFSILKTYATERPVNSADMSPIFDHVVLGGGQDASQVTVTSARAGKFESIFYHKVFAEQFGSVRGHFGPINTVTFSPDGRSFSTGGEDGYVRLHHFDQDYFTTKFF